MVLRENINVENFDKPTTINKNLQYEYPEMSYVGHIGVFYADNELQSKEDLFEIRENITKQLSNKKDDKLSEFQRKLLVRKLTLVYLYIDYFEYFEKRFGKKTFRFIGKEMDIDFEDEKMIIKASNMDSLIDMSHDGGFVDFWAFGDAILFRTIKKLRV